MCSFRQVSQSVLKKVWAQLKGMEIKSKMPKPDLREFTPMPIHFGKYIKTSESTSKFCCN